MKTIHLITTTAQANILQQTIALEETLAGEIIILTEALHLGPLYKSENETFAEFRQNYWQGLGQIFTEEFVSDEQKINTIIQNVEADCRIVFWMAPNALDVTTYYWLLPYFYKHTGLLHVIAIDSLPFFNEKGILFYPKNFTQIQPKEMAKCRHLIKEISPADYEIDLDEWTRISEENGMVRSHEVGKKISTRNETHFDSAIYLSVNSNFAKANKVLQTCMNKGGAQANEFFMADRLKKLVAQEVFIIQGDAQKTLKDFEIKSTKSKEENVSEEEVSG